MPSDDREPPTTLAGFRVVSELGRGGMGVVYAGWDDGLLRRVALKLLAEDLASTPALRERFLREARAAAALVHPNIAAIHAIATCEDGRPMLVMELVEGESLRARLTRGGIGLGEARTVAIGIASALAKAHAVGIVHRDLKPENVVIGEGGHAKLLDFGIAKVLDRGPAIDTTGAAITASGQVVGTAGYIAPEQIEGLESDQRVDVFAFGVVLFEILGGVRPFEGATPVQRMVAVMRDAPSDLAALAPAAPPAVRALVLRCIAKRADDRPVDGATLLRDLEAAWPVGDGGEAMPAPFDSAPTEAQLDVAAARAEAGRSIATDPTEANQVLEAPIASPPPRAAPPLRRRSRWRYLLLAILVPAAVIGIKRWSKRDDRRVHTESTAPSTSPPTVDGGLAAAPSPSSSGSSGRPPPRRGKLPPEVIQSTIQARFGAVHKCRELLPAVATIRSVWFVITVEGTTRGAAVRELPRGYEEVDRCLVAFFSSLVFPRPEGGEVTITYPIAFHDDVDSYDTSMCGSLVACLEDGTCTAKEDRCVAASDQDCLASHACTEHGECTADRGKCRARYTECGADGPACRDFGLCVKKDGFCRASDEGCRASRGCRAFGLCRAEGGSCRPTEDDCNASIACRDQGRCDAGDYECGASDATCAVSTGCTNGGLCTLVAGVCAAARDEDCARSHGCTKAGRCAVGSTRGCVAKNDAHCRESELCRERGQCVVRNGQCTDE